MPFVAFNGITAKVLAAQAGQSVVELGNLSRGVAGAARREVRATKRAWRLTLRPLNPDDGYGLVQMLLGRGHGFPYNSDRSSAGGLVASTDTNPIMITAADSAAVFCNKYGAGSLAIDGGTTNLLSANERTGTDTSGTTAGFTAVDGAALSSVTTHKWQGSRSLQVVTSAAVNGVRGGVKTTAVAVTDSSTATGSVWVKATSAISVRAYMRDEVNAIDGTPVTVALTANQWHRIDANVATGVAPTASLYVLEETADAGVTFFCDGLQVENGFGTAWADGTRAASQLNYSTGLVVGFRDLTVSSWVTLPKVGGGLQPALMTVGATVAGVSNHLIRIDSTADGTVRFVTNGERPEAAEVDSISVAGVSRRALHLVTCVLRNNPRAGQAKKELWVDGVLGASSSPALPNFVTANTVAVGHRTTPGHYWALGTIDDLLVLPYAAGPAQIAAWYAGTRSLATQPKLTMTGDLLRSWEAITVEAITEGVRHIAAMDGSTFRPNMREITCVVEEV